MKIFIPFLLTIFSTTNLVKTEDNFENSKNICQRCSCTNNSVEFTLDCKNRGLKQILLEWPPHNTTLLASFSHNNITTLKTLPFSEKVLEIVLDHCGIKFLDVGLFQNVRNVEFVDFSYNLLTSEEVSPEKFKGTYNNTVYEPISIKHLNLAYNMIHSLGNNLFEHMQNLSVLNLEGNRLRVLDSSTQEALRSLKKLERLNLANNQLTELVGYAVSNFDNLIELNLANNMLDFVPNTLVNVGKTLEILNLNGNPIVEMRDKTFVGVNSLIYLSMNELYLLHSIDANSLAPLSKLRKLSLCNNTQLKHIEREAFAIDVPLQELYLNDNSLSNLDYNLIKWSNLRILQINNNPFKCTCDLYNITKELSEKITINEDGPICIEASSTKSKRIYDMKGIVCDPDYRPEIYHINHRFGIMRIVMITLSILLILVTLLTLGLGIARYQQGLRRKNYPYATQITYNRLQHM